MSSHKRQKMSSPIRGMKQKRGKKETHDFRLSSLTSGTYEEENMYVDFGV